MNLSIFKGYEHFNSNYPTEAVKFALENRNEAIPELLEILDYTLNNAASLSLDAKYLIHIPAIYILAYFNETRAYENILKLASLPDKQLYYLYSDIVEDDFKNIIASVCDGNITPIKQIIEDTTLDEFTRAEALQSLLILLNHDVVSRDQLVLYFKKLLNGKLEADRSYVWSTLPQCCALIHPTDLLEDIEKAVADGKIMELIADLDYLKRQQKRSIKEVLDELKMDKDFSFITKDHIYSIEEAINGK